MFGHRGPVGRVALVALVLTSTAACDPASLTGGPDEEQGTPLNFYEQELVGLWARWHSYDGSSHYIRFNADRTACKWEEPSGSDARVSTASYSNWSIDDTQPAGGMDVVVQGSGLTWMFDYPDDEIWPAGYRGNLARSRSNEAKTCS